ncbi:hypothetical protein NH287_00650 [Microbacterium sp. CnD16-F]|uniref:hypothetical protein n=1 Tax=Microbacterium sp. CnD16-F TaxID=2954493 RepID=UPI0020980F05|nr:hypothetical protein [Microbacterium sp. CnD16-F]MCO7202027.1 hypothetical protein [Microbacterium sp. CnD16-F]
MMRANAHPTAALAAAAMAFALMTPGAPVAQASAAAPTSDHHRTHLSVSATLAELASLDRDGVRALLDRTPGLIATLLTQTSAADAAIWWAEMDAARRDDLIRTVPVLVGSLDGIDAADRVRANRYAARARLARVDERLQQVSRRGAEGDATLLGDLLLERRYLTKVVAGQVRLYLYSPERGAMIEMAGDPSTAAGILLVVPGTNASVRSFMVDDPITSFADWQVANADPGAPVVAFTVLAAPMPQISLNLASGPQNNTIATAAGADYARIVKGIEVALPGLPTLSYEHSAGSQVGSSAEMHGARFDVRFLAGGVGATDGYRPVSGTTYYAAQAAEDVNRYYAGFQVGDIGYGVGPEDIPGVIVLDPGYAEEQATGSVGAMLMQGLDLHNRLFSGDGHTNGTVLKDVRLLLASLARGSSG